MGLDPESDIVELRVANGAVTLQALARIADDRTTVAIVPGLAETAADWRLLIEQLAPIPAAAVTLRGRGSSGRPASGYSLADHASDIDAFVRVIQARSVVLVAFSRSVAYALEYATARPSKLAGLVLLDYPPRHTALPVEWVARFAQSVWRGRRADEVIDTATIAAIQAEAAVRQCNSSNARQPPFLAVASHIPPALGGVAYGS